MTDFELHRLISPEYAQTLIELDSLVASLPDKYPDDIEYFKSGFRLPLYSEGMPYGTYYTVTKELPYPYPEEPDWASLPASLGKVTEQGRSCGYETEFEKEKGLLTSKISSYDNNEFLDEEPSTRVLSEVDIRKLIEDLLISQPIQPDKDEQERTAKATKFGSLIRRVLFRI